jgi:hypothetical protein
MWSPRRATVNDAAGPAKARSVPDPATFERANYIKTLASTPGILKRRSGGFHEAIEQLPVVSVVIGFDPRAVFVNAVRDDTGLPLCGAGAPTLPGIDHQAVHPDRQRASAWKQTPWNGDAAQSS